MSNDVSLLHYFTISLDHFTISPSSGIHPISFFPAAMGRKPAQKDGQPLAKAFAKGAAAKQKAPAAKTAPKTNSRQDQASLKVLPVVPEFGDTASKEASGSAPHQAVPPAKRKEFAEGSKDSFGQALAAGASDEGHLEPHKRLCLESAAQTAEKAVIEDLVRAQLDKANQEHQSTGLEVDTGAEGTISKSSSTALGAVGAELGNNDEVRAAVAATEPSKGSNEKCPDVKPEVKPSSPPQEGKSKNPLLEETQSAALAEAKNAGEEAQAAPVEKKDEDPASSAPLEPTAEKDDALSSAVKGEGADDGQRQDQGGDLPSLSSSALPPSGGSVANESSKHGDAGDSSALQQQGEEDVTMDPPPEEAQSAALPDRKNAGEEAQTATVEKKDDDPASLAPREPMAGKGGSVANASPKQDDAGDSLALQQQGAEDATMDPPPEEAQSAAVGDFVDIAECYRERILQELLEMTDESRRKELEWADMHPDLHEYNASLKERGLQELSFEGGRYKGGFGSNASVPLSGFMAWLWEKEQREKGDDSDEDHEAEAGSGSDAESITALIESEMSKMEFDKSEGHFAAALLSIFTIH